MELNCGAYALNCWLYGYLFRAEKDWKIVLFWNSVEVCIIWARMVRCDRSIYLLTRYVVLLLLPLDQLSTARCNKYRGIQWYHGTYIHYSLISKSRLLVPYLISSEPLVMAPVVRYMSRITERCLKFPREKRHIGWQVIIRFGKVLVKSTGLIVC